MRRIPQVLIAGAVCAAAVLDGRLVAPYYYQVLMMAVGAALGMFLMRGIAAFTSG